MYVFNRIIVKPQLPKSINRLDEIANNLWWSWNTEYLRLLKRMDRDLWENVEKNPVKFTFPATDLFCKDSPLA